MNLSAAQNIYLHCGQLIDTEKGVVLTKKTVIVSGEKIKAIKSYIFFIIIIIIDIFT